MKNTTKVGMLMLVIALAIEAVVTSVSAGALGEGMTIGGYNAGWILLIAGVGVAILFGATKLLEGKTKTIALIGGILVAVAGIGLVAIDIEDAPVASTVASITWDVTAVSGSTDMTIDNDARTITKLIWADVDLAVINATDDSAWVAASDDPVINFTISPSLPVGVSETTNQATTTCAVLTPDQSFTEDSTEYDLFEDASSGGDKNLVWTTDGTDDYESKLCTVTIGSSEVAQLTINFLDDGLSQYEAGESQSFQISLAGITYTMTVIVTALT